MNWNRRTTFFFDCCSFVLVLILFTKYNRMSPRNPAITRNSPQMHTCIPFQCNTLLYRYQSLYKQGRRNFSKTELYNNKLMNSWRNLPTSLSPVVNMQKRIQSLPQAKTCIPDSSEDEGCKEQMRISYFVWLDASMPADDSVACDTRGNDELWPL